MIEKRIDMTGLLDNFIHTEFLKKEENFKLNSKIENLIKNGLALKNNNQITRRTRCWWSVDIYRNNHILQLLIIIIDLHTYASWLFMVISSWLLICNNGIDWSYFNKMCINLVLCSSTNPLSNVFPFTKYHYSLYWLRFLWLITETDKIK